LEVEQTGKKDTIWTGWTGCCCTLTVYNNVAMPYKATFCFMEDPNDLNITVEWFPCADGIP